MIHISGFYNTLIIILNQLIMTRIIMHASLIYSLQNEQRDVNPTAVYQIIVLLSHSVKEHKLSMKHFNGHHIANT